MWWKRRLAQVALDESHEDLVERLLLDRANNKDESNKSGAGAYDFLVKNPQFRASKGMSPGLSSVYIGRNGKVHILQPHKHDETARGILPQIIERDGKRLTREEFRDIDSRMMPMFGGAIRAQFYLNGVGATINMVNPPSMNQLKSLKEHFDRTTGEMFVAEIYHGQDLIAHINDYDTLVDFLKNYKTGAKMNIDTEHQQQLRDFLSRMDSDESWYGKELKSKTGNLKKIILA